jgi:hypothetical protein
MDATTLQCLDRLQLTSTELATIVGGSVAAGVCLGMALVLGFVWWRFLD